MSPFTPGPWVAVSPERARTRWSVEAGDTFIADLNSSRDDGIDLRRLPAAVNEANARLIASAPEGYALLREIEGILARGGDFQLGSKGRNHDLMARLAAYFAKVEGP